LTDETADDVQDPRKDSPDEEKKPSDGVRSDLAQDGWHS